MGNYFHISAYIKQVKTFAWTNASKSTHGCPPGNTVFQWHNNNTGKLTISIDWVKVKLAVQLLLVFAPIV